MIADNTGVEQELEVISRAIVDAGEQYVEYFGRPLSWDEIRQASVNVGAIKGAAGEFRELWVRLGETLPTGAAIRDATSEAPPNRGDHNRMLPVTQLGQRASEQGRVSELVNQFNGNAYVGYEMLRTLGPTVPYVGHYVRECKRLVEVGDETPGENRERVLSEAIATFELLETIRNEIQQDVQSHQSQIQILSMRSQTILSAEIRSLTSILILLTLVVVLVSVGVLIATVT